MQQMELLPAVENKTMLIRFIFLENKNRQQYQLFMWRSILPTKRFWNVYKFSISVYEFIF